MVLLVRLRDLGVRKGLKTSLLLVVKEIKDTTRKGGKSHVILHRCMNFRTT